jgi:dTDP-4-dehydrorhamnose 3,5-epimerase
MAPLQVARTAIPDVLVLEPRVFADDRGSFFESFNQRSFAAATGLDVRFVQDNQSRSLRGVLRGLHYQLLQPQGKLVRAVHGTIFDVAVDIRPDSATRGRWVGVELSAENRRQLWIPPGLAHGFVVRSEVADVLYKATDFYAPEHERCIRWDDPVLAIDWGLAEPPRLSSKDAQGESFPGPTAWAG